MPRDDWDYARNNLTATVFFSDVFKLLLATASNEHFGAILGHGDYCHCQLLMRQLPSQVVPVCINPIPDAPPVTTATRPAGDQLQSAIET